jgi:5S rRNA maturation endonuclease (ribonuclease M5)
MNKEDYKEKHRLEQIIQKISRDTDTVIVEGWADKKIIQKLGFKGKVFLSAEKTHQDLVEDVSRRSEKAAVLTDFDQHSKKQAKEISRKLQQKVDVIRSARKQFGKELTANDRRAVEDARTLFEDKEQKFVEAAMDSLYFRD